MPYYEAIAAYINSCHTLPSMGNTYIGHGVCFYKAIAKERYYVMKRLSTWQPDRLGLTTWYVGHILSNYMIS